MFRLVRWHYTEGGVEHIIFYPTLKVRAIVYQFSSIINYDKQLLLFSYCSQFKAALN